jgi:hypothetical protein
MEEVINNLEMRIKPQKYRCGNEVRFGHSSAPDSLVFNGTRQQAWLLHFVIGIYHENKRGMRLAARDVLNEAWKAITDPGSNDALLTQIIAHYNTRGVRG